MSPSAPASMFLITANVRTSFASFSPLFLSASLPLSSPPVLFLVPYVFFSLNILSLLFFLTVPFSPFLALSPGVSLSSPHKARRQRIRALPDMTCRRWLWGAVGTHTLDSRRQGSSAPTNETPDCRVKCTLCACVWVRPYLHNKKIQHAEIMNTETTKTMQFLKKNIVLCASCKSRSGQGYRCVQNPLAQRLSHMSDLHLILKF